jgi:uncharacterized protein DUF6573
MKEGDKIECGPFDGFEVIYAYTRAQAIEDGELIDVSELAREAGFRFPVAVTRAVWTKYVEVPNGLECQDEKGRLWDIVWMASRAIKLAKGSEILFSLLVQNDKRGAKPVTLKAVCGPGDNAEPVITIMLQEED